MQAGRASPPSRDGSPVHRAGRSANDFGSTAALNPEHGDAFGPRAGQWIPMDPVADQHDDLRATARGSSVAAHSLGPAESAAVRVSLGGQLRKRLTAQRTNMTALTRSVDYEEVDSVPMQRYYQRVLPSRQNAVRALLCVILGFVTAALYYGLHHVTKILFELRVKQAKAAHEHSFAAFWGSMVGFALIPALIGAIITILEPSAGGSGMPEVISFLNGLDQPAFVTWQTLGAKMVGMVCIVSSGLYSGYDGPLIHACAIIGIMIVRNLKKIPRLAEAYYGVRDLHAESRSMIRNVRSHELQVFATLGAACGVATAFQAPVAGVIFALEEAISFYSPSLLLKALFACSMTMVATSLYSHGTKINGDSYSIYSVNAHCSIRITAVEYLSFVIMGVVGGVFGHFYNVLVAKIGVWRAKHIHPSVSRRLIEVVVVVLITMTASSLIVELPTERDGSLCTPFDRSLKHLVKVPPTNPCANTCGKWVSSLNAMDGEYDPTNLFDSCIEWLDDSVCLDARIRNQVISDAATRYTSMADTCNTLPPNTTISLLPSSDAAVHTLVMQSIAQYRSALYPPGLYFDADFNKPLARRASSNGTALAKRSAETKPLTEPKCYHQVASLVMNQPEDILKNLFARGYYYLFEWKGLLMFGLVYLALSLFTHHISMPTDLVLPVLVIGATFGRLYALGINQWKSSIGSPLLDPGASALLGMAAFWAGTSRMMITIIVIALQSTNEQTYLNGITLVVILATVIGNLLGESQYHLEIEAMHMAYLPDTPPHALRKWTVEEALAATRGHKPTTRVVVLDLDPTRLTAGTALDLLSAVPHTGFPVIQHGRLQGLLLRDQLVEIINSACSAAGPIEPLRGTIPRRGWRIAKRVSDVNEEFEFARASWPADVLAVPIVDLVEAALNRSPLTVTPRTAATKAYRRFRTLGARHMVVADDANAPVAVVTRADLHAWLDFLHHHRGSHRGHHDDSDVHGGEGERNGTVAGAGMHSNSGGAVV
ncbi:hypothetical protein AMAG_10997 [Allomyces macrogynus ATCC 38327]|uniref:Chloride channel protein n=1 Tax=Allomyces macrogynus (strain ATCC 38327) TaxID=578462 RepID=A0A0L0SSJ5_ALLM3|nr:hypothetical protein AMAG_10997 [Allomyces macrogynus ATCC 38327]|eukprot:KNE65355.1 hypothetical protein AMAG_10997 [Allomyces macrogynus ATCC 38327]